MHQHAGGDIVGMIILNLEVIDLDGAFKQLVLDFFNNDVFPVDKNQNISRAEVRSVRPALRRTIKRVRRRGNDLLTVDENMRQFIRFIDVGFDNPLQSHVSACLVPCLDEIPDIDLLNWNVAAFGNNGRPGYKAIGDRIGVSRQRTAGYADCCVSKCGLSLICKFIE